MEASVYGVRDKRNPDECMYVGSTTKPTCVRFAEHLIRAYYAKTIYGGRHANHMKFHVHMYDQDVSNFEGYLIEKCNKEIRCQREQFHMDRLKPKFNLVRAFGALRELQLSLIHISEPTRPY